MTRAIAFLTLLALVPAAAIAANAETGCRIDSDCACGRHIQTGRCFYGQKAFVNRIGTCPDFCEGVAHQFEIRCIEERCSQVSKKKRPPFPLGGGE